MKKRIVSLLLTLSILFGMAVPTMTPRPTPSLVRCLEPA